MLHCLQLRCLPRMGFARKGASRYPDAPGFPASSIFIALGCALKAGWWALQ